MASCWMSALRPPALISFTTPRTLKTRGDSLCAEASRFGPVHDASTNASETRDRNLVTPHSSTLARKDNRLPGRARSPLRAATHRKSSELDVGEAQRTARPTHE